MSDLPTPHSPGDDPDPFAALPKELADLLRSLTGGDANPQLKEMLGQLGLDRLDPAALGMLGAQVQAMMTPSGDGPVDRVQSTDIARKTVAAGGDPSVSAGQSRAADDALGIARLWLDAVTGFAATDSGAAAWSRAQWVEATMPHWADLVEPVAEGVSGAVGAAMRGQLERLGDLGDLGSLGLPEGLLPPGVDAGAMLGSIGPVITRMSAAMFSLQLGQAVGALAGDVLSGTEVALPLVADRRVVLLPTNIAAFAEGLGVDAEEVLLYLTVRESARIRLFASVPWVAPGLMAAVRDYAKDISIDTEGIESAVAGLDLSDPAALQAALGDNLFSPRPSAAQRAALGRLETLLALVEGWVDVVTERATTGKLPHADALGEAVRRRRATGGPAERTFSSLVGLELRPRRLRDAANLWRALEDRLGADHRDDAWRHPDIAPSAADLDDILGYVDKLAGGGGADDMDRALDALLDEGRHDTTDDNTDDPGDDTRDDTGDDPAGRPGG